MDATYSYFRRLMAHWHQSREAGEFDRVTDTHRSDAERHARRLIAQCGHSWESTGLAPEDK